MAGEAWLVDGTADEALPITPLAQADLDAWLAEHGEQAVWVRSVGFTAEPATICLLPGADARLARVLLGVGGDPRWDWAGLPQALPAGTFRIEATLRRTDAEAAAFGWAMGTYRFDRYRRRPEPERTTDLAGGRAPAGGRAGDRGHGPRS